MLGKILLQLSDSGRVLADDEELLDRWIALLCHAFFQVFFFIMFVLRPALFQIFFRRQCRCSVNFFGLLFGVLGSGLL